MPLAISITSVIPAGNAVIVTFNVTPTGVYTTGINGDILDFTTATQDAEFQGPAAIVPSSLRPLFLYVGSQDGQITDQYCTFLGTTIRNCRLMILTALGAELGTAAYPALILNDRIVGLAVFSKGV